MPAEHEAETKLPAVSGSSGKLVIERSGAEQRKRWYPGRIFADEDLSYEAAMAQFVVDSCPHSQGVLANRRPEAVARAEAKAERKGLWQVTADMVVDALRRLLPAELQFLISDRGIHFTAKVFQQLAQDEAFIHVLIARHRPQSNGIAERLVRPLKAWLKDKPWHSPEALESLLQWFLSEYNNV